MSTANVPVYFGTADYVMLGLMLAISMAIGLFFAVSGNSQKTKVDYLLGGRRMTALPVCLSLFATFQSAIALLGIPTELYAYGTMVIYFNIGVALSYLLATVSVVPLVYQLRLTSVNEYLARRYDSRRVQTIGAIIGIITTLSYMTIALLSPALALETAVGVPLWLSIILIGAVGTIYTTLGGIKSVVWTDVFQTFVMFAGIFTLLIKGCMDVGGVTEVWTISKESGRIILDELSPDPRVRHTVWNLTFGFLCYHFSAHFTQSSVQRVVSLRSIREAYKAMLLTIPLVFVFNFILILTGLVLVAYFFSTGCDPLAAGYIKNKNQLVPYFVLHAFRFLPGLSGLYISTIFSGALSTLSSGINALAANTVEDFLSRRLRDKSESVVTGITKFFVFFYGCLAICLAYLAKSLQGPVTQLSYQVIGASTGPLLGLFLLSAMFPQVNSCGVLIGIAVGLVCSFWLSVGSVRFGHPTTRTLPPGPIDKCFANNTNDTMTSMTTEAFTYLTSGTQFPETSVIFEHTTRDYNVGASGDGTPGLQNRGFSIYDLSYIWYPVVGVLVTMLVGLVASVISSHFFSKKLRPDARLLFPFARRFWYSDMNVLDTGVALDTMGEDRN